MRGSCPLFQEPLWTFESSTIQAAGAAPRYKGLLLCLAWDLKRYTKGDALKFSDGSSKLLSGHKFQDKYAVLSAETLRLYRDIKVRLLPAKPALAC